MMRGRPFRLRPATGRVTALTVWKAPPWTVVLGLATAGGALIAG